MSQKLRGQVTGKTVTSQIPSPAGNVTLVTFIPWTLVKRTVFKEIITPIDTPEAFVKEREKELQAEKLKAEALATTPLLRALGLAFYWQQLLDEKIVQSMEEIAALEKFDVSYVRRILKLTLLAPHHIEQLMKTPKARLHHLLKSPIPYDWGKQTELVNLCLPKEKRGSLSNHTT